MTEHVEGRLSDSISRNVSENPWSLQIEFGEFF